LCFGSNPTQPGSAGRLWRTGRSCAAAL